MYPTRLSLPGFGRRSTYSCRHQENHRQSHVLRLRQVRAAAEGETRHEVLNFFLRCRDGHSRARKRSQGHAGCRRRAGENDPLLKRVPRPAPKLDVFDTLSACRNLEVLTGAMARVYSRFSLLLACCMQEVAAAANREKNAIASHDRTLRD